MALNILSIATMSADPKHLFLGVKITVSDRQNQLRIYTIKALECLKLWLKIKPLVDNNEEDQDQDLEHKQGVDLGGGGRI